MLHQCKFDQLFKLTFWWRGTVSFLQICSEEEASGLRVSKFHFLGELFLSEQHYSIFDSRLFLLKMPKLRQWCVNLLMSYSTLTFTRLLGRFLCIVNVSCSYLHIVCSIHFSHCQHVLLSICHRELLVCMTFFKNVLFTWPLWVNLFFYCECHTSYRWIYFVLKLYKYFYVLLLHWDFELLGNITLPESILFLYILTEYCKWCWPNSIYY